MKVIVNLSTRAAYDDNDLEQTLQAYEISMRVSSKSIKKGKGSYKR
jgi:stalled ribosome alternative rescue factor ArfA